MQDLANTAPSPGKWTLRISLLLFLVFFVNLLSGKANVLFHWGLPHLESVAEFLLLAAASTTLIWSALHREAAQKNAINNTSKEAEYERSNG
jgi:hypothetical protein